MQQMNDDLFSRSMKILREKRERNEIIRREEKKKIFSTNAKMTSINFNREKKVKYVFALVSYASINPTLVKFDRLIIYKNRSG